VTHVAIREVSRSTPRTRLVRLDAGTAAPAFRAGQAVMAGFPGVASPVPYSIASPPSAARRGLLELLVPAEGAFGETGDVAAAVGRAVEVSEPFGAFGVPEHLGLVPLVCIAGGTGIAPIRAVLLDTLERQSTRSLTLVYSARALDEFVFDDELSAFAAAGRIRYLKTVTREEGTQAELRVGRVDAALIGSVWPGTGACSLICGPADFVGTVRSAVLALGADAERIVVER